MILLFLDLQGALFHSPLVLKITVNSIQRQTHLGICLPTAGSQTWVRSVWEFFPHKWWIKSIRNQHIKCNERPTRPCHRAYYIGGATPFHSCIIVRSPKLVSSEDRTGPRPICFLLLYRGSIPFTHCTTSAAPACRTWRVSQIICTEVMITFLCTSESYRIGGKFFLCRQNTLKEIWRVFLERPKKIEAPSKNPTKSPIMWFVSLQKLTSLYQPWMAVRYRSLSSATTKKLN